MSTANKLTYLNETKSKIKQAINIAGANITNEPFRQYSSKLYDRYLDILKNGTGSLYSAMPKVTGTGTELSLQNTAEAPMVLELSASESTQDTTTGKNLFNKNDNSMILDGYYVHGDFRKVQMYSSRKSITIPCMPNETYTVSKILSSRFAVATCSSYPVDNVILNNVVTNHTATYITITSTSSDNYIIVYCYDSVLDTLTPEEIFASIQIEQGSTATNYEPYTGGIASPNPDYPQEINVVTGENSVKLENKNLIDASTLNYRPANYTFSNLTNNSYKIEVSTSGTWYTVPNYKITNIKPNTSYTIKIHVDDLNINDGKHTRILIDYISEKNNVIDIPNNQNYIDITATGDYQKTITTNANTVSFIVRFYVEYGASNVNAYIVYKNLQLEKGSTATSYVEHKEQTFPLSLGDKELAGISDYKDKIFNNIPSNPLYDSNLVEGGWYKYKMISKYIFTGNESFTKSYAPAVSNPNAPHAFKTIINSVKSASNDDTIIPALCNYFMNNFSYNSLLKAQISGFCIAQNHTITICHSSYTYDNDLSAFKNWLAEYAPVIRYPLETPTKEQITDTTLISQLEAIKNAVSYDDETNISQTNANRPFIISASAISNTIGGE